MHVLVVGEDRQAGALHCQTLQAAGFHTDLLIHAHADAATVGVVAAVCDRRCSESRRSQSAATASDPATSDTVVVLDCHAADGNATYLLQQFRALGNRLPVLVLAAHATIEAQVDCLDAGADDYLATPCPVPVLVARLRALVRRQWPHLFTVLHVGGVLRLNLLTREATRGGQHTVALTARETFLLELLMRHAGETCSRTFILEQAWGYRFDPGTKVLEVNINRLRAKIDDGFETRMIETVHGIGYRLSADGS